MNKEYNIMHTTALNTRIPSKILRKFLLLLIVHCTLSTEIHIEEIQFPRTHKISYFHHTFCHKTETEIFDGRFISV